MRLAATSLVLGLLAGCAMAPPASDPASDAPERRVVAPGQVRMFTTYREALDAWRRPEDMNAWIGATFEYDVDRAVALSESQRALAPGPAIFEPDAFFAKPAGICVDLARFAVETLKQIAPELKVSYLMIEFDPARLRGQVLRRHWVVVYEDPGGVRVVADSKRPGVIAGPYRTVGDFIAEYARFRGREIVAHRQLESFRKKSKVQARRVKDGAATVVGVDS